MTHVYILTTRGEAHLSIGASKLSLLGLQRLRYGKYNIQLLSVTPRINRMFTN